jgi:hypothetical protein
LQKISTPDRPICTIETADNPYFSFLRLAQVDIPHYALCFGPVQIYSFDKIISTNLKRGRKRILSFLLLNWSVSEPRNVDNKIEIYEKNLKKVGKSMNSEEKTGFQ